jgi:hypothetical protein
MIETVDEDKIFQIIINIHIIISSSIIIIIIIVIINIKFYSRDLGLIDTSRDCHLNKGALRVPHHREV